MQITALVENTSKCELKPKHGLALFIQTKKHNILFDLGSDNTLFRNAKARNIDLSSVDVVIVSHGHIDHGGALKQFLKLNSTAKVYVQKKAFEFHSSKFLFLKLNIGLDKTLKNHPQVVLLDGDYKIDEELELFTLQNLNKCYSSANDALLENGKKDEFLHEQNLIIKDTQTALVMGCGHSGIVNVMEKAQKYNISICVGGFHLYNPLSKKTVSNNLLKEMAKELNKYSKTKFYTCHCTGVKAFEFLSKEVQSLSYLSCGESIEI